MPQRKRNRLINLVVFMILGAAVCVGCKSEPPRLRIDNATVEFSEAMFDEATIFLTIRNDGGKDTLLSAKTSIPYASATIHEMRGDIMTVSNGLVIPARGSLELTRKGPHIMITNMPKETTVGYHFTLTLNFKKSGEMQFPLVFVKPRMQPMTPTPARPKT